MTSSSQYLTIVKMETPTSTVSSRGRKRTSSQSSQGSSSYRSSSSVSSSSNYQPKKKLKKYELDPSKDITVRNALAAKKNREKKKAEEIAMKQENMSLKLRLAQLEKEFTAYKSQHQKLNEAYEEEANTHFLITPLGGSSTVKDALEAIMPRLNEKYASSFTVNQIPTTPSTTTTSSSFISTTNTCNTSTSNTNTSSNNNDDNHQVSHHHHNNNDNENVVQTYVCLNDPVQWDASKYIEDFHLDDDVDIDFPEDENNKYSQPGDLESSFNFNDLANFNDSQQETAAEFLQIDFSDKKPLVTNSDPFFGLHISAEKKNVIIDHKPKMMCPPKLLPDLKSMQSLTAEG